MPMIPMYRPGGETIAELLLRQGEASARAAERSALLWGNAVSNIGNIAGGAVAQYQEQQQQRKQQEQRERMLDSALSTFDPQNPMDFYRRTAVALGPEPAMRATSAMVSLVKMQQEQKADPKDAAQVVGGLAALEGVTPGYLRKNWATVGPALKPVGAVFGIQLPDNPAELPEDFGQQIIALNQGLNKQTEQAGFTLSPGQVRYGPKGEILAQGPEAPAKPEKLSPEEAFIRAQYGDKPTAQQLLEGRSRFAAAGWEPDKPAGSGSKIWVVRNGQTIRISDAEYMPGDQPTGTRERPVTGPERRTLSFYMRAQEASDNVEALEDKVRASGAFEQARRQWAPNILQSTDDQLYRQAQRAFTEARLRKDSGATIKKDEYEGDAKTYFAQPGDSDAVLEQKRRGRAKVLESLKVEAGRAYDEEFGRDPGQTEEKPDPLGIRERK